MARGRKAAGDGDDHPARRPTSRKELALGTRGRSTLSVGWDGRLYDCDFNQMLELALAPGAPAHVRDFDPGTLRARRIATGNHCYGCTAGAGSSCGGATT